MSAAHREAGEYPSPLYLPRNHREDARDIQAVPRAGLNEMHLEIGRGENGRAYPQSLVPEDERVGRVEHRFIQGDAVFGSLQRHYPAARSGSPLDGLIDRREMSPVKALLGSTRGMSELSVAWHGADPAEEDGGGPYRLGGPEGRADIEGTPEIVEDEEGGRSRRMEHWEGAG